MAHAYLKLESIASWACSRRSELDKVGGDRYKLSHDMGDDHVVVCTAERICARRFGVSLSRYVAEAHLERCFGVQERYALPSARKVYHLLEEAYRLRDR